MKIRGKLPVAWIVTALLSLVILGDVYARTAFAQPPPAPRNDDSGPIGGNGGQGRLPPEMRPGPGMGGSGRMMMAYGPATVACNSAFVYVVRGGTVYQLRASDLSFVSQRELPEPRRPRPAQGDRN